MKQEIITRNRVKEGIKWLNRRKPNWFKKINFKILNMGSNRTCVCGQALGSMFEHFEDMELAIPLGFYTDEVSWDFLQKIWIEEIKKLRKAK